MERRRERLKGESGLIEREREEVGKRQQLDR